MEEAGILEKITRSGFCYPALNQVPAGYPAFLQYLQSGRVRKIEALFLRFRGLQPGIRRNSFYGKHLYEVVREAEIPPQLSAIQGFRVIFAN